MKIIKMTITKILILAIIAIFSMFNFVDTQDINGNPRDVNYSADQLVGIWYLVAEINIEPSFTLLQCIFVNITKIKNNRLNMATRKTVDGQSHEINWSVSVDGNKMTNYASDNDIHPQVHVFDIYEDRELFVVYNSTDWQYYMIYHRHSSVNDPTLKEFKILASIRQWHMEYIDNRNCHPPHVIHDVHDESNEIATQKFIGTWYMVYELCPRVLDYDTSCAHMNVTKYNNEYLKIETYKLHGTIMYLRQWNAKIYNMNLCEVNNNMLNPPVFLMKYYANFNEVFFRHSTQMSCDSIWSLQTNISEESLQKYKKMAHAKNWLTRQIKHEVC